MSKKTYRTYSLKGLQLRLKSAEGKKLEIIFRGGIQIDSTAKFSTSDKSVQDAIEKCSGFNRDYYLESEIDNSPAAKAAAAASQEKPAETKPEPIADVKDVKRFHNIIEMREAMIALGLPVTPEMSNYIQLKAIAAKAGYDFQIQKNI